MKLKDKHQYNNLQIMTIQKQTTIFVITNIHNDYWKIKIIIETTKVTNNKNNKTNK